MPRKAWRQVAVRVWKALDTDNISIVSAGVAFYGSGQWTIPEGYAAQKFMKAGLSNNHIDPNARLCMASAVTGFLATYGVDEPASCYDDLDACDVLIMWGNNPAEMHPVLFSRVIDRRSRGEKVTLIDIGTRMFDAGATGTIVFEDGRLIGAVAYGLSWGPSPIAGITPFEEMDDYLGSEDPLHAELVRKWMISAVARALRPGWSP